MTKWTVVCDSVEHWASSYDGPPFHAILTDPPYHLIQDSRNGSQRQPGTGPYGRHTLSTKGFMGKEWDGGGIAFQPATWAALAAHLLPGAHVLSFGGDRTHHRLMCAIEDAGLELRGCIYYCFGSGFPKSLNVGKAIDKAAGARREVIGPNPNSAGRNTNITGGNYGNSHRDDSRQINDVLTAPATPAAATWEGYGSALKPAVEVIVMARKPLDGTIAANCQRYGSGALAIDASRIRTDGRPLREKLADLPSNGIYGEGLNGSKAAGETTAGRWPANLILDDSEAVAGLFPVTGPSPMTYTRKASSGNQNAYSPGIGEPAGKESLNFGDSGSAARFFFQATWELDQAEQLDAADVLRYAAKASRAERDAGLNSLPLRDVPYTDYRENTKETKSWVTEYPDGTPRPMSKLRNAHPTVKPLSLCRYLATLLLPPAAYTPRRILVPFAGVGSEMIGAGLAGWDEIVGIEQELEYTQIAEARLAYWLRQPELALR